MDALRQPLRDRAGLARVVTFASLALLGGGCILFVSPDTRGDHCRFEAEESTCGRCLRERCESEIDQVCRAGREGTLADLEACTRTRGESCTKLMGATQDSTQGSALAACVSRACPGACAPAPPNPTTRCVPEPFGNGRPCSCTLSDSPNSFVCSELVMARTICCAPKGWPAPGLACACLPLDCSPNTKGCQCFRSTYGPDTEQCGGGDTICCKALTSCACGAQACKPGATQVETCSVAAFGPDQGCDADQVRVSSCSRAE